MFLAVFLIDLLGLNDLRITQLGFKLLVMLG